MAALILSVLIVLTACSSAEDDPAETQPTDPPDSAPTSQEPSTQPSDDPSLDALPMRVHETFFGVHDGRVSQGIRPDAPVGSLRFWDSGTSWLHIETSPGQFTWDPLDTAVATAEDAGARPVLVMGQSPPFHASRPGQDAAYGPGAASMPDMRAWRRYVAAVAERYGNRIDYQIWNETNIVGYWAGTPKQMARLTVEAAGVIRKIVPKATVVAPPFALRLPGQQRYFEEFWSLQSRGFDLAGAVDVVAVHLYPAAEDPPEAQVELLESAREVLAEEGIDLPVWNTEINYGLLGGPEPPPIPDELQRAYLMRTYLLNAGMGVERTYWYSWNIDRIANTYVTEEDLVTETLAGQSFDVVRDWLVGTRVDGCGASDEDPAVWECTARKGMEERIFWWKPQGPAARLAAEGATSWTDADGAVTRCPDTCRVPVGETPVMVTARN